jgi:hypothetical protein
MIGSKDKDAPATARGLSSRLFWIGAALATVVGAIKRLTFPGTIDFPLGEGGLFVLFSEAIIQAGFALPATVTFGTDVLPFAYPPAGFYLAALLSNISGTDLFTVYHVLPRFLNLLAIPVFCLFAARVSRNRVVFLLASLLYALMPDSMVWQITGGGLPRSLAAILALAALATAIPLAEGRGGRRRIIMTGLLVGLAVLSHLEWGIFAATSVSLLIAVRSPLRRTAALLPAIGLVALLLILPWLLWVFTQHGLAPFQSSMSGSGWSTATFVQRVLTVDLFASTLAIPALLGMGHLLRTRDPFLLLWPLFILLLTPRMADAAGLAIPTAILAAYGLAAVGEAVRSWLLREENGSWRARLPTLMREPGGVPAVTIALALFFGSTLFTNLQWLFTERGQVEQLSPANRRALAWIRDNAPADSRFVVVTPAPSWYSDRIAEWFPYLAGRESLTTAQGQEWAGPGRFSARLDQIGRFKLVQLVEPAVLPTYLRRNLCDADFVAVFMPDREQAARALIQSPLFRPVHRAEAFVLLRPVGACLTTQRRSPARISSD